MLQLGDWKKHWKNTSAARILEWNVQRCTFGMFVLQVLSCLFFLLTTEFQVGAKILGKKMKEVQNTQKSED